MDASEVTKKDLKIKNNATRGFPQAQKWATEIKRDRATDLGIGVGILGVEGDTPPAHGRGHFLQPVFMKQIPNKPETKGFRAISNSYNTSSMRITKKTPRHTNHPKLLAGNWSANP